MIMRMFSFVCGVRLSFLCLLVTRTLFEILLHFSLFGTINYFVFRCSLRGVIYRSPSVPIYTTKMIHFDAVDFNECRSKEVMNFSCF